MEINSGKADANSSTNLGPVAEVCPVCAAERKSAAAREEFCEVCGYNFRTGKGGIPLVTPAASSDRAPVPPVPEVPPRPRNVRWELHAEVDPAMSGSVDPDAPTSSPVRLFPLDGDEALIGRRSARRRIFPEVALDGDDGISHRHAKLLRQTDGSFALLDLGSSNGVRLNGKELVPNVLSPPLVEGDRLELGRWTRLVLRLRL